MRCSHILSQMENDHEGSTYSDDGGSDRTGRGAGVVAAQRMHHGGGKRGMAAWGPAVAL
jgi:hypothetical protein